MDCLTSWSLGWDWETSQKELEWLESGWTRSGNSSGGTAKSVEKEGVNSTVGKEEEESGMIGWEGNMLGQEEMGTDLELDNQCLKGKILSLKTTSLETKQVIVAKS